MTGGGDGGEGFLGRWSRLKRRNEPGETTEGSAQEPAGAASAGENTAPAAPTADDAEAGTRPVGTAAADLPELPELPSLDSITATTDMRVFMHPAVPDSVRNAALRKLWSVDPAIRDFVSPALDYAYDWNTPGGAPGYGALGVGDDVARMLSEAIKGFSRPAEPREEDTRQPEEAPRDGTSPDALPPHAPPVTLVAQDEFGATSEARGEDPADPPDPVRVTTQEPQRPSLRQGPPAEAEARPDILPAGARRRHGGALPS